MKIVSEKEYLKHYFLIIVGTFLLAIAIRMAYEPLDLVTGGVSGLAIIIKEITKVFFNEGIPLWVSNILLNVPLFAAALLIRGKKFLKNTVFATIMFTIALAVVPSVNILSNDYLLSAIFGGVIGGAGMGLVFITMSSTGGTDLLAMIIHKYLPYHSVPQILIVIDVIIVVGGILSFGLSKSLYAIIAVYVTTKVSDGILEGLKFAKMAYIISDEYDEIARLILHEIDRGVTGISATGMYSNKEKKMLFCVVSKKEIIQLTEIAAKVDPKAFVIVSDAREVMGEGFREYRQ